MLGLLTWPAYGTWFARPDRGWIDRDEGKAVTLSEPTRSHAHGRQRLKWPPVRLDERQQAVVIGDLARVSSLRYFEPHLVAAAPDHVHVLLSCAPDRDVPRMVQLIKGALSRALTVAAGDETAQSTRGRDLLHHKWWTRQYSFRWIEDGPTLQRVAQAVRAHADENTTVWEAPGTAAGMFADMRA
jgi:REP element-mobilizing transposase RayT